MSKSLCALFLLSFIFTLTYCATPVTQCDNGIPLPITTQVNDCEATPCELSQGSTAILTTVFESSTYTTTTRPRVIATSLGISLDYPLEQTNGCDGFLNVQCPIAEGDLVNYELQMPILSIYPKVAVQLEFSLLDENEEGIFCFVVDTQIV